jgi:propanol-preferring alcohol dehydrogenase
VGDLATPQPAKAHGAIVFAPVGELVPWALENLDHGGTLALAGIYMTDLPPLAYESCLFHERTITSVTANTREDGDELLREAARIPIRTRITTFPLPHANLALQSIRQGTMPGSGVLVLEGDHG